MKKLLLVMIIVTMSLSACSSESSEVSESTSETTAETNIVYHTNTTKSSESEQIITEKPGNIASNHSVDEYFNMLPDAVIAAFYRDNWSYAKVDYSLGDTYYNGTKMISGLTDFDNHIIYIDNRDEVNRSILHEVGHRFEYEPYVKGFQSKEFQELYDSHSSEWYVNYGGHYNNYATAKEAYAQCYEIYFISPDCLDEQTRKFISQEIDSIEKS